MVLRAVLYYFLFEGTDYHKDIRLKRSPLALFIVLQFIAANEAMYWLNARGVSLLLWYSFSALLLGAFLLYYQFINIRYFSTISRNVLGRPQLFGPRSIKILLGSWFGLLILIGLFMLYSALSAILVWLNPGLI